MRAVADTGPLNYLVLIHHAHVLPRLFGRVCIPLAVHNELARLTAPADVREWIAAPPGWLSIMPATAEAAAEPMALDAGEQAAIALATAIHADILLMDDRAGVTAARAQGIEVTGTLGILHRAAQHGFIDLAAAFATLRATNFHVRQELLETLLAQNRQRHRSP